MSASEVSLVRAVRGPITLITVGVLFALNNFTPYQFHQTWPVILIVFGLLSLLRRGGDPTPRPYPQTVPPYPFPPANPPSGGTFRQSQYPEAPPAGPAKGGFGTSAPPRPEEPGKNPGGPQ
jgi:hypothetical protein